MKHLSPAEIETIRVPEPKHDPFSLESLVAWLERQQASRSYKYTDPRNCLAAQYWRAHGLPYRVPFAMFRFWSKKFDVRLERIAVDKPRTFGAALTRARAALASQKGNANG